jgi:geranylgeranyl pyrophosphate synthase
VVDDILDITATTEELGKTAGKDLASAKTTYPSLVGLERSREVGTGRAPPKQQGDSMPLACAADVAGSVPPSPSS